MKNFLTLGWQEFATFGRSTPGGWATKDALYCVEDAYDLNSEDFLISYLCHEGRHFADYELFPGLHSVDLEYRAKLTELSLLEENLFESLYFFLQNANKTSLNAHSAANYFVIRDLSEQLFDSDFEQDIERWQAKDIIEIHSTSKKLLDRNTRKLKEQETGVSLFQGEED